MHISTLVVDHVIGLDGSDQGQKTVEIGPSGEILTVQPAGASRANAELTAIPLLADAHAHLAISDGVEDDAAFHTLDRVDAQLHHLAVCGVGHIVSLGTDQRWLQERLRRRLASGDAGGKAFGYSAGIGFGAIDGWPPELTLPELRFRPGTADTARRQVADLAGIGCRLLKIWVDDFGGKVPRIRHEIVEAIIDEARKYQIVTFAHVHFHRDAEELVSLGIGALAHSVRDKAMDQRLIDQMAENSVTLVPTLSREEAEVAFSLDDNPYMKNAFFLACERELLPRLWGKKFSNDPETPKRRLDTALENVGRAHRAGVPIGLGTDSGFKLKLQGFSQHRELQLLNEGGLSPRECLRAALQINQRLFATGLTAIAPGEPASFFLVEGNPLNDIRATEHIRDVWVCGKRLSESSLESPRVWRELGCGGHQ